MALTGYTTKIGGAIRIASVKPGGMKIAHVQVTIGATTDYAAGVGFDINADRAKFGFQVIFDVLSASIRSSAGTLKAFMPIWDQNTKKLRFWEVGAAGPLDEMDQADLAANDVLSMVVIGV
jgi:hypothetical protein